MEKTRITQLIRDGKLRIRSTDIPRIKSLLDSARNNAEVAIKVPITEESATLIFREFYESIRQIGDARWWSLGYEPTASHEVSMEILKEINIKDRLKLNSLERFRRTRNNANYRGYKVTIQEAKEIVDFWNSCALELMKKIESSVNK
jgi:hypothetical protein